MKHEITLAIACLAILIPMIVMIICRLLFNDVPDLMFKYGMYTIVFGILALTIFMIQAISEEFKKI